MKILFAGGGTGGHLFPGVLIANQLRESGNEVRFLVSGRAVENSFFQKYPYERSALSLEKNGKAPSPLSLAVRLPKALLQASKEIHKYQPDVVIGIGGFVSLPAGIAARMKGVPLDLLEINTVPGKATRALKRVSRNVYCAFPETQRRVGKKGKLTGPPIRNDLGQFSKSQARAHLGFSLDRRLILVMGGSQGASGINRAMISVIPYLKARQVQVLHLSGANDYDLVKRSYVEQGLEAQVHSFFQDMALAYAAADLAISRGGAATVAELAASGLASIIVPYPNHADRHQWWNGKQLGSGSILLEQKDLPTQFEPTLQQLIENSPQREQMSQDARKSFIPHAVNTIVESILN